MIPPNRAQRRAAASGGKRDLTELGKDASHLVDHNKVTLAAAWTEWTAKAATMAKPPQVALVLIDAESGIGREMARLLGSPEEHAQEMIERGLIPTVTTVIERGPLSDILRAISPRTAAALAAFPDSDKAVPVVVVLDGLTRMLVAPVADLVLSPAGAA